jgi:xylulokinase
MVSIGERGYLDAASRILRVGALLKEGIAAIPGLRVLGDPLWVIAFAAAPDAGEIDIYQVLENMGKRGWSLNGLQRPPAVHVAVTLRHTLPGVAERFLADLGDAIIWMDSRGAPYARAVTAGPVRLRGYGIGKLARWVRTTAGLPSRSGKDSIAHILWLRHAEPAICERASLFLEPKDWLNLRLTGRGVATYDSIALHWVTGNRHPDAIGYDPALLRMAGLDRAKLPDLVRACDIVGPLLPGPAADLGIGPGIPVVAGSPDLQSAAIGSGATGDFQAHLSVGTSSWLTCHVPFKNTDLLSNIASLPSPIPGSGGLIFTPWLYGERTPVEDHFIRGGFHNLSLGASRAELVRSVLEGVALNTRWLLGAVERFAGRRLDPIRVIGGGARSDVWCQIFADVLGRTMEQVADPVNAGARGAALLAAVALGELTFSQVPDLVGIAGRYRPDAASQACYDRLYKEFRTIYRRERKAHARLNQAVHAGLAGPARVNA